MLPERSEPRNVGELSLKKVDQPADTSIAMQLVTPIRPVTAVNMRRLAFETTEPIQFLDITDDVAEAVRSTGVRAPIPGYGRLLTLE